MDALRDLHFPPAGTPMTELISARTPAHRRLIFEEFWYLELGLELKCRRLRDREGTAFVTNDQVREALKQVLPFKPTTAQKRVLGEIVSDMKQPRPMRRLLQGDVGSGKTIVAFQAALGHGTYTVASNGRVTAAIAEGVGGCLDCASEPNLYMYLAGPGRGFQMDFSIGVDTGSIEPQSTSTLSAASLSGSYVAGTVTPVSQSSTYATEALSSNGVSALTIMEDLNEDSLLLQADVPIAASYSVASNGRVAVTASGSSPVYYLVSPTRAFAMDLSSSQPILIEINQ